MCVSGTILDHIYISMQARTINYKMVDDYYHPYYEICKKNVSSFHMRIHFRCFREILGFCH